MAKAGAERRRPLYARALRLRRLRPGPVLCFIFLEGAIALGVLLALARLASWWAVLALPVAVAVMVKLNDVVAGAAARRPPVRKAAPRAADGEPEKPAKPDWPLAGNASKPVIEDDRDEDDGDDGDEEDTEKTESPTATRSSSE